MKTFAEIINILWEGGASLMDLATIAQAVTCLSETESAKYGTSMVSRAKRWDAEAE